MAQTIRTSAMTLVAAANAAVRTLSVAEARALHGRADVTFVDIRDVREVAKTGRVAGAHHVPRGMLEFWIDPESPYVKPEFQQPGKRYLFFCASGEGWRSGLSAQVAQELGLTPVCRMTGGFKAWKEAGGPVETPKPKQ